jgi:hypothetical protein
MSFFVFDLDGTLADCTHRVAKYLTGPNKDYRAFYAACPADVVIPHVRAVLWGLASSEHRIEIWSGRSDEVRSLTENWLDRHQIDPMQLTFMRPADDRRPDDVLKLEFLNRHALRPTAMFEDRERCVTMWRAQGIPVFQVAEGKF